MMIQFVERDSGAQGLSHLGKVLGDVIGSYAQQKEQQSALQSVLGSIPEEGISDELILKVSEGNPSLGRILQAQQKQIAGRKKEVEDTARVSKAVESMLEVLSSVGPGQIGNLLTEKGRENRQLFDSLAMNLEEIAATMVGKGTLSKARFEFLLKNLPSSKKTQAANRGALKAWNQTLGLNVPQFGNEKIEEKVTEKLPEGGKLTMEMAQSILNQAKGDKELARKIARKRGFEF